MVTQTLNVCIKASVLVALFSLGLGSLSIEMTKAQSESISAKIAKIEFIPPKGAGVPKSPTTAGGTRPIDCHKVNSCLIPLVPAAIDKLEYYPLTVAERPTFYISLPKTSGTAIFTLYQHLPSEIKKVHRFSFPVKTSGGIIAIALPESSPALQNGSTYEWTLSLNSDSARGLVRRVQLEPNFMQKLNQAKPSEKLAIYAAAGIWYDSIGALAELKNAQPYDQVFLAEWSDFLKSMNIDKDIVMQEFTPCCQAANYSASR